MRRIEQHAQCKIWHTLYSHYLVRLHILCLLHFKNQYRQLRQDLVV